MQFPTYDFGSSEFKAQVRALTKTLVEEWSSGQAPAPAGPAGDKGKKRAAEAVYKANGAKMPQWEPVSGTEEDDEQERRSQKSKKAKTAPSAGASVASAASEGSGSTAAAQDPVYKRLLKLAQVRKGVGGNEGTMLCTYSRSPHVYDVPGSPCAGRQLTPPPLPPCPAGHGPDARYPFGPGQPERGGEEGRAG